MSSQLRNSEDAKGKDKDKDGGEWELNWWDLLPLVDNTSRRAVAWTHSNSLLTSHTSQTILQSHVLDPSSSSSKPKTTTLPYNLSLPASLPPQSQATIMTVSPRDEIIFAYFPTMPNDVNYGIYAGVGLLWEKDVQAGAEDAWLCLGSPLTFAVGEGAVAARWLMEERRWTQSDPPTRLPSQGPQIPTDSHIFIVVTESSHIRTYGRSALPEHLLNLANPANPSLPTPDAQNANQRGQFYHMTTSALASSMFPVPRRAGQNPPMPQHPPHQIEHAARIITRATIGMGYDDATIMVFWCSKVVSTNYSGVGEEPHDDLESAWEDFSDENVIEWCWLRIIHDHNVMFIRTVPNTPINLPSASIPLMHTNHLPCTGIEVIPVLPEAAAAGGVRADGKQKTEALYHLAASFVDFHNHCSPPTSIIHLWSITRTTTRAPALDPHSPQAHPVQQMDIPHLGVRKFDDSVVVHMQGWREGMSMDERTPGLLVGLLNTKGTLGSDARQKGVEVGRLEVLSLRDLTRDNRWEITQIRSPLREGRVHPPLSLALSSNSSLVAACSTSDGMLGSKTVLLAAPRRSGIVEGTSDADGDVDMKPRIVPSRGIELPLAAALLDGYRLPSDVIASCRLQPSAAGSSATPDAGAPASTSEVIQTMAQSQYAGPKWEEEVMYVSVDVEMANANANANKSARAKDESEKKKETVLTARDIRSVEALIDAFEIARDAWEETGVGYELELIWPLHSLTKWLLSFLQKMMRECLLFENAVESTLWKRKLEKGDRWDDDERLEVDNNSIPLLADVPAPPILIHVLSPSLRQRVILALGHVLALHRFVKPLKARGENAQVAKEALIDLVGDDAEGTAKIGGVRWLDLHHTFTAIQDDVKTENNALPAEFPALTVALSLYPELFRVVRVLTESNALSKAMLFEVATSTSGASGDDELLAPSFADLFLDHGKENGNADPFALPRWDNDVDVLTKERLSSRIGVNVDMNLVARKCLRCDGISEKEQLGTAETVGISLRPNKEMGVASLRRWKAWLGRWERHCMCGGVWVLHTG